MPELDTSLGILSLSLPRYVALGKRPNLSVPLLSSLENKNNNNNNTYFVMLWSIKEQRYAPFMVHLLYPGHCPKCLIFTIFLKFSQQLYEVDTIIGPNIIEETMESRNYKYVSRSLLGLVF